MPQVSEDTVEQASLQWLGEICYEVLHGPDIAPGQPAAERQSYGEVVNFPRKGGQWTHG